MSNKDDTRLNRKTLVRIVKWLIAIAVAVGLALAVKSALQQWKAENDKLRTQIAELTDQLNTSTDSVERDRLAVQRQQLRISIASPANMRWERIFLAALLYAIGLLPPGFVLAAAIRSLGEPVSTKTALAAQTLGHAGKYVPGKAMVIVLRAGALSIDSVSVVTATISVFMETLLMMAVGAAVAGVVICWLPVPSWLMLSSIAVAVAASIPTLPPILKRVAAKVAHRNPTIKRSPDKSSSLRFFVVGWSWSLLSWLLIGAAFTLLVSAIPSPQPLPNPMLLWAVCTAAIALAMVIGFASLLPGGAGVRELVLTMVLTTAVGPAHALLAAIATRLMFIVVEAVGASLAWFWMRRTSATQGFSTTIQEDSPESVDGGDDDADEPELQPE